MKNAILRLGALCAVSLAVASCSSPKSLSAAEGRGEAGPPRSLDIYFIDTEGGGATLIVSPGGESLLIDPGYPGGRDPRRISKVAKEAAGLRKIDAFLSTHFDLDHYAALPEVLELIPIERFYDRGVPDPLPPGVDKKDMDRYVAATKGASKALAPGDVLSLRGEGPAGAVKLEVLAASGRVLGEEPGAPQIRPCEKHKALPEDRSENAQSVAVLLSFGEFRLFAGGDLTWNVEHKLVCPKNIPGQVDVFQVDHHGFAISNNPALVEALNPRVAVVLNGPTKGGDPETFARLRAAPALEGLFAMHRNLRTSPAENAPEELTLSSAPEASCPGGCIHLSVRPDGKEYSVSIPSKGTKRTYAVLRKK